MYTSAKSIVLLCGNFYIALDSDAIMLNELFDMKLTKFSNLCDKCGFSINSLEKYELIFRDRKLRNLKNMMKNFIKNVMVVIKGILNVQILV